MNQINKNINKSKTLSSKFYCNGNIFEEFKKVFEESLQPICSIGELSKITVYPFTYFANFLNEELIITNYNDDYLCMPNICTHRGHILNECSLNTLSLQCKYHGRTFNLNGELKNAPGFKNALDFPSKNDNLECIPIFNWNNFLFISLSKDSKVFDVLSQIDSILPAFPYNELSKTPIKKEYTIDCHWALYCDNYLEGFHIPYVHKGLNNDMIWDKYETQILDRVVLQKAKSQDLKEIIPYDEDKDNYAYYFFIFPNIMINYYKWGISINIVEPISHNKTMIKYMIYNLKEEKIPEGSSSSVDTIELEDQNVVLSVQKGIKSRYYDRGRFSPDMEKGVHYFHRLISENLVKLNKDFKNI